MAESFGTDARRYDRARPGYPDALVARIVAGSPGLDVLDVGCGTGIAARQFQAAGCAVIGVEPDARMAEFARPAALRSRWRPSKPGTPGGRKFDTVIAAQSWHWVDPVAGLAKAAQVLPPERAAGDLRACVSSRPPRWPSRSPPRTGGWRPTRRSSANPPVVRLTSTRRRTRSSPTRSARPGSSMSPNSGDSTGSRSYTRDQWLDLLPTTGGLTCLHADQLAEILDVVGGAIDSSEGHFTMAYPALRQLPGGPAPGDRWAVAGWDRVPPRPLAAMETDRGPGTRGPAVIHNWSPAPRSPAHDAKERPMAQTVQMSWLPR